MVAETQAQDVQDLTAAKTDCPTCPDGFLTEMSTWTRDVARQLAERIDLGPLTEEHWLIIDYVRQYYLAFNEGPPIVKIGKATGLSAKRICELFPCGVGRGAYRLAGLPRPSGCL